MYSLTGVICLLFLALLAASPDELYRRGVALLEAGEAPQASELLREAVALQPSNAQFQKALGVSLASQKRYSEADPAFAAACRLNERLPDACYYYGRNLYALDRFSESLAVLSKLEKQDPQPWRILLGLAQAYQGLGSTAPAEKMFRASVAAHAQTAASAQAPASGDPRVHFGSFLFREGRTDEAGAVLAELCRERPDSARGHLELGRVRMQLGDPESAEAEFRKAVQLGAGPQAALLLRRAQAMAR